MAIKLISVNVERSKHLDRALPFLAQEAPDVTCVQEMHERDLPQFEAVCGSALYAPMTRLPHEDTPSGIAILSRLPVARHGIEYYRGSPRAVQEEDMTSAETIQASVCAMFLWADVAAHDATYRIGTTHFTWTPDGQPDEFQRRDITALIPLIEGCGEIAFTGDFNAPRGRPGAPGEIYALLAARWRDEIPRQYETSIDIALHRAGKTKPHELADKMVDYLFTSPAYAASDVRLVPGVSDHMAIVAHLTRI